MQRSCGILLSISSLPSPYGIGTLGKAAYQFIDFLAAAGQSWWQVLPVGPTSCGDSPYQSFSTFAGNPYFIDLDLLAEDGLLDYADIDAVNWGDADPSRTDYLALYENRLPLLEKAARRGWERDRTAVAAFVEENRDWLPDYTLFMALKRYFGMRPWTQWPDEGARLRRPDALEKYRDALAWDASVFAYVQFLFYRQWTALRDYAREWGVGLIGDIPIYVALDSADVWANPQCFALDENRLPREVAGVPPDYFTADGQLWGNPLYDWDAMRRDGYRWWVRRIGGAARLYDALRIDHFRGLESYWSVPAGETTAKNGHWNKGPGMDLVGALKAAYPDLFFIAEDLGYLTPAVRQLLSDSGFPGMKVLEFAFDAREPADYRPHTYPRHSVCYAGTHDNATLMQWKDEADPADIAMARLYLGLNQEEGFHWGVLRGGLGSVSGLFIAQMQDYLGLGADARMNTPGTLGGNWQWRLLPGQLKPELAEKLAALAKLYGRERTDRRGRTGEGGQERMDGSGRTDGRGRTDGSGQTESAVPRSPA